MECQWRFVYAIMAFLGLVMVYMMRVNLNVALVVMVNASMYKSNNSAECSKDNSNVTYQRQDGEYNWSDAEQVMILASFYWGYTLMQIPCGILSLYYSAKWMYGISTLLTAILTLFTPLAAGLGASYLVALRFFIGLVEGPTFPTQYTLSGRWVLDTESSAILTFISAGSTIGTVVGQTLTGVICQYLHWSWVFYLMGIIGIVWFIIFAILVSNKPSKHPFISLREKEILMERLPHNRPDYQPNKVRVPWLKVFTSRPYLALMICTATYNFTWYTMINCLPIYIGIVLGFDISKNGGISSLPYIALLIFSIMAAFSQDWLRSKDIMSLTKIRKLFICFGMVTSAIFLYCLILAGCDVTLGIFFLCTAVAMLGISLSSTCVNLIDMAPSLSGALLSVINVFNSVMGIITPYVKGYYTRTGETRGNWSNIFITASTLSIIGSATYLVFGSASLQPWAHQYQELETVVEYIEDDKDRHSDTSAIVMDRVEPMNNGCIQ